MEVTEFFGKVDTMFKEKLDGSLPVDKFKGMINENKEILAALSKRATDEIRSNMRKIYASKNFEQEIDIMRFLALKFVINYLSISGNVFVEYGYNGEYDFRMIDKNSSLKTYKVILDTPDPDEFKKGVMDNVNCDWVVYLLPAENVFAFINYDNYNVVTNPDNQESPAKDFWDCYEHNDCYSIPPALVKSCSYFRVRPLTAFM